MSRIRAIITVSIVCVLAAIILISVKSRTSTSTVLSPDRGDGASFNLSFRDSFNGEDWYVSDFTLKSTFFRVGWIPANVHYHPPSISLELNRKPAPPQPFSGAEVQKRGFYGHGRYEVVMQAAPGSGAVSSFFTHTDATFGDPHDEIDIEFLGKNTRQLHANIFTKGKTRGSIYIDLPFDAAEEVHLYAFDWQPDKIAWYVDDKLVKTVTSRDRPIPETPGRIIMNIWTGTSQQYSWHGEPTFADPTQASYYCVSFRKAGDASPQCSDTFIK
ncbi:MAG: family 16 glycosylhydrolase [Hyphomonas oceanitis]|uniref:family 16 glycosylhydrolase n=1 Tax=Hyphomonas oceanitis TaxID=81033 RepID=UPI003002E773